MVVDTSKISDFASMRPRHKAAENIAAAERANRRNRSFNEAAA